jgi:DNA mismatch endonuclease, patch repair protein
MARTGGAVPPSAARSRNMAAVKRSNTKPEVDLRRRLHAAGYRFRKDFPIRLEGRLIRPDIAFTRRHIAVFVDGCFWHSCPAHGSMPATNQHFWQEKLEGNVARDREQDRLLGRAGWTVIRIWEHEPLDEGVNAVAATLIGRAGGKPS